MVNMDIKAKFPEVTKRKFTPEEEYAWEHTCECRPQDDAYLCWYCRERNRVKYGNSIPIIVNDEEVIP